MGLLTVTGINKKNNGDFLLKDISFTQGHLQKVAIAGETGAGKSTLMRIVAGLGQADSGTVFFEDKVVKGVDEKLMAGHPGIAYLSQHFELHNNYRVEEILSYANKLIDKESKELFAVCRVDHLLKQKTNTLSGGERQRVALARLLTHMPHLLLLDEPYSNMDLIHKNILKAVIKDIQERLGVTCMLISHDPEDMLPWADEIYVMLNGEIIQRGTPQQIYRGPLTEYTAGLFGRYNVLGPAFTAGTSATNSTDTFARPEDLIISTVGENGVKATVTGITYHGSYYEVEVFAEGQTLFITCDIATLQKGDTVFISRKLM